jgi:beta-lactamase regulating signal transducer with metallopeptidase domain
MSSTLWTASPTWTAAGWTMLHLIWVGAVIGLMAALVRRLLISARPETRYGAALTCLAMLSVSPLLIFARVYEPMDATHVPIARAAESVATSPAILTNADRPDKEQPALPAVAWDHPAGLASRSWLEFVVPCLPWFWLSGSACTLSMLATGLIGVEQLRRSSRLDETGDLSQRCRALADSLGIARRVSVGICDRLAMPVLIGIVRPLILLPPIALSGWSAEQLEMVLLHELAHLRRWDNLVNLLQRVVESLVFFHPVVWWLSGWVRLERELCCDRLVVERLGRPVAYAEMLVALSGTSGRRHQAMLAMADRHVLTRIRRLFNLEERSMKLTMPEGLGLLGAVIVGVLLVLGSQAAPPQAVSNPIQMTRQIPGTGGDDVKDKPLLETRPPTEQVTRDNASTTTRPLTPTPPKNLRAVSISPRDARRLQIVQLPTTPEGAVKYQCRGGIKIVCKSQRFGTIRMEADEAVIKRVDPVINDPPFDRSVTWSEDSEVPMEIQLRGNVIVCREKDKTAGDGVYLRASALKYDFVTGRAVVLHAKPELTAPEAKTPTMHDIKVMPRDAPQDVLVPGALPSPVTIGDTRSTPSHSAADHQAPVPASRLRTTTLLARSAQRLQITQLAETIEGVVTLVCRGGIRMVSKSPRFGTVSMEADEAVIVRNLYRRKGETHSGPDGATWVEEDELPMRVHLKGDVILRQNQETTPKNGKPKTFRARELDYNFVTDRVLALDAEVEEATAGAETPVKIASPRIEQFHPMVRQPDGSLAPSEHPEIRAGGEIFPK